MTKKINALRFVILVVLGFAVVGVICWNPVLRTKTQVMVTGEANFNATAIEQSTVLVRIGDIGEGSGVAISPHMILTAKHCVGEYTIVVLPDGNELEVTEVFVFEDRDVAVLFVEETLEHFVKAGAAPESMTPTWVYARLMVEPGGNRLFGWTSGIVSVTTDRDIILDQAIYLGMSGGGAYNANGELIGLVVALWRGSGHMALVEPIEPVMNKLAELGLGK